MKNCPSLEKKSVSPHVFRHSTAMALLQAGIDISTIAIWLGHESIETTHKYMVADIELKQKALQQISAPVVIRPEDVMRLSPT
jgi:site-specific recombinase XerD